MPQSQIIRSPADVSDLQASGRLDTSEPSATPISLRSAADVYFRSSGWRQPMIARTSGHFVASGGVRINFLYHSLSYPTSGPGRNRVEIEKRSDDQRTVIARPSSGVRRVSCGGPPAIRRSPADVYASGK
ncbi:hypothetical protein DPMN_118432 [Dreissena polymorpha]|uniref:Uncharacterized protein n=1 Tax=Dreissena polymorpha TaxID=45954 RepID=A0A9D4JR32_DREPO|nr:hypothetical protein DPMN_118432 [Dreissena polymorpha]